MSNNPLALPEGSIIIPLSTADVLPLVRRDLITLDCVKIKPQAIRKQHEHISNELRQHEADQTVELLARQAGLTTRLDVLAERVAAAKKKVAEMKKDAQVVNEILYRVGRIEHLGMDPVFENMELNIVDDGLCPAAKVDTRVWKIMDWSLVEEG